MTDKAPATQGKALAKPRFEIVALLDSPKVIEAFKAVATKYMTPEKMLKLCINAAKKTKNLDKCDPHTVLGAMMTAASLGLEPNTIQGHAYLIPYKTRGGGYECQFQLGYKGLVALARRSPDLVSLQAEAIHQGDEFDHCIGSETFLRFRKALENRGEFIGAFCYIEFKTEHGEGRLAGVMPREEIEKIRSCSQTYNSLLAQAKDKEWARKKLADTPWVKWFDEMAVKSVIKRTCKQLDLSPQLAAASNIDSLAEANMLDLQKMRDANFAMDVVEGVAEPMADDEDSGKPQVDIKKPKTSSKKTAPQEEKTGEEPAKEAAADPGGEPQEAEGPAIDPETGEVLENGPEQEPKQEPGEAQEDDQGESSSDGGEDDEWGFTED